MEIPNEIINKIKSYIPRDCDMKSKTSECINNIIQDYKKIPSNLKKKVLFKKSFHKYALLYIKAERNFFHVRLNRRFFNSIRYYD